MDDMIDNQFLNGNDARAILNIVFKWIEEAPLEADPEDLRFKLEASGYEKPGGEITEFVKKEVPGSEEIQKMGDEILADAMKVERSRMIDVGREMTRQLKQHGLQMTVVDGWPILTNIEEQ